ncbi:MULTISPECIES: MlaD family protein [unclassified Lysobacter]|uniref:MlaD family protein n=1 Tax=unclassified Lysobacter TaxID=2635362 RepID=UPI001F55D31B|nr:MULTISPECIES: MlaD family protein [unclassified Lysobacter]
METKANYVLIGAFTILVAVFGLLFALWAAKYSADKSFQEYYVIFNEPVTGLTEGGSVQYNGISVGTIEELSLNPRDPRQVRARLKLEASAPVKVDTKAKLSQAGITGSPFIQLTGGSPNAPRLVSNDADTIPVITTEPSALQNIADTASKLVARLDKLMSEENIEHIDNTLTNLDNITAALGDATQKEDLRALVRNARLASEQLNATLESANGAVANIDRELPALLRKLDATLTRLDSAAGGADAILNENRAAIQSFANDGLAQLGPTLGELRALVRDLRRVTDRLDGSPARYLLGRDAPKEFEPE